MKPDEMSALADTLSVHEEDLLLGNCKGWGSWMFEAGEYLVSLGLGTKRDGSIAFDTPLAVEFIAYLRAQTTPSPTTHPPQQEGSNG